MSSGDFLLGIGIPLTWPYVASDFFDSFMMMQKPENRTEVLRAGSGPIHEMRNNLCLRAMDLHCTHLLFLDADMRYPVDLIPRILQHEKEILGALCFKRWPPFCPTLYEGDEYNLTLMEEYEEGLIEVTATGTACLLIDLQVLENIPFPWFEFSTGVRGETVGEDIGFCYKARDAGYKIHVDTTIKTEHLTIARVNENLWRLNQEGRKQKAFQFGFY